MKKTAIICIIGALLIAGGCDLFNKPIDADFRSTIEEEVAWANAPKLAVHMYYNGSWGNSSPGIGQISPAPLDIRQGYESPVVEFTPLSGFYFKEWLAFDSSGYNAEILLLDLEEAKNHHAYLHDDIIEITRGISETGAVTATIKVNQNIAVTLVPFCDSRPHILQTNPPLINTGFFYTRGQEITIWMNLGYTQEEADALSNIFRYGNDEQGRTLFRISAQNADGSPYEMTEDFDNEFYNTPQYDAASNTISIRPKEDNPPPGNLTITVTVGTGVLASSGEGMPADVLFSYQTGIEIVTKAYKANNVWAIHNPDIPQVGAFFHQMAPEERDRRLRKNDNGDYEITLYFSVSRSVGEIREQNPDTINIAEVYYAELDGTQSADYGELVREVEWEYEIMEDASNSAGGIYRQQNPPNNSLGVTYYRMKYTLSGKGSDPAGIYRLVILPYHTGAPDERDDWERAANEGRFVTVVIDNKAPGGSGSIILSGHASIDRLSGNVYKYNQHQTFRNLIITTHFAGINDNFESGGRTQNIASPDKPWTLDERSNISWQYRLVRQGTDEIIHESDLLSLLVNPPVLELHRLNLPQDNNIIYNIQVQFIDNAGNESGWTVMGRIKYVAYNTIPSIDAWGITYNSGEFAINWIKPHNVGKIQVLVFDEEVSTTTPVLQSVEITDTEGNATISGITADTRYLISFSVDEAESDDFILMYSFPGMSIDQDSELIVINQDNYFESFLNMRINGLGVNNNHKQYVLEQDIDTQLTHTPIGSGINANNAFAGKFYGNGKTIKINNFAAATQTATQFGLFGTTNDALIQDLTVEYTNDITRNGTDTTFIGGIAGNVLGSTQIIKCSVIGGKTITLNTVGYIGGIAGSLDGTSQIVDSTATVNIAGNVWNVNAAGISWSVGRETQITSSTHTGTLTTQQAPVTVAVDNRTAKYGTLTDVFTGSEFTTAGNYTVTIREHQNLAPRTLNTGGVNITLIGEGGERRINLSSNDSMFVVSNNTASLTLGSNITLVGRSDNNNAVVRITNGNLTMLAGSKVTGNTNSGNSDTTRGTVNLSGTGASFNMKGGEISGNEFTTASTLNPAGLYIANGASAHLEGGNLSHVTHLEHTGNNLTMSGTAQVGTLTLGATSTQNASLTVAQNWTGNVGALDLRGGSSTMTTAMGYWVNKEVIKAQTGTLSTTLVNRVTAGSLFSNSTSGFNSLVIGYIHQLVSSGTDIGKLVQTIPYLGTSWTSDSLAAADNGVRTYALSVTSETNYRIWWDDQKQGNGTSGRLDIKVSAEYQNGTAIFTDHDNGWFAPRSFTANQTGIILVKVRPFTSGTGSYRIVHTTGNNLKPGTTYTTLSNHTWKNDSFTSSQTEKWYTFTTNNTTHRLWWDDSADGSGHTSVDIIVNAYYLDGNGSVISTTHFSNANHGYGTDGSTRDFSPGSTTRVVLVRVTKNSSTASGNFRIVYNRGGLTRPSFTHIADEATHQGTLSASSPAVHYTFTVIPNVSNPTFRVYVNDSHTGNNNQTADVVISIYWPDGTVVSGTQFGYSRNASRIDANYANADGFFFTPRSTINETVLVVVEPKNSGGTGTFRIGQKWGSQTRPSGMSNR